MHIHAYILLRAARRAWDVISAPKLITNHHIASLPRGFIIIQYIQHYTVLAVSVCVWATRFLPPPPPHHSSHFSERIAWTRRFRRWKRCCPLDTCYTITRRVQFTWYGNALTALFFIHKSALVIITPAEKKCNHSSKCPLAKTHFSKFLLLCAYYTFFLYIRTFHSIYIRWAQEMRDDGCAQRRLLLLCCGRESEFYIRIILYLLLMYIIY